MHPRIGALDVLPFVPLGSASMDDAVAIAHAAGRAIAETLRLPVFLYEAAARSAERRPLEAVRRGGLAGLAARLREPAWQPDYGPAALHPTAGAMAIGARGPLVAWNLELDRARSAAGAGTSPAPSAPRAADSPASRRSASRSSTPARCRCR